MDNNRNTGLTPEERQNVVNEVFAERAAAEEAAKERKNQEEAANREQGWKLIFEYLDKVKDEIVKPILTQKSLASFRNTRINTPFGGTDWNAKARKPQTSFEIFPKNFISSNFKCLYGKP